MRNNPSPSIEQLVLDPALFARTRYLFTPLQCVVVRYLQNHGMVFCGKWHASADEVDAAEILLELVNEERKQLEGSDRARSGGLCLV